jgi:very-short-patch-repair endonuclease
MTPGQVVRRLGGRAGLADVLRYTTEHYLRAAVTAGDIVRPARGIYALPTLPDERLAAAACRGVVSHESAAALLRLPLVLAPDQVHITVPRGARPTAAGPIVLHRRTLLPADMAGDVTTPLRTVLDCCLSLPFREALAVADAAAHRFGGLAAQLVVVAEASSGPGRGRRLRVARAVDPLAENPFESALRGTLLEAGLTGFQTQVAITPRDGQQRRVDLADVELRIVVEADSFEFHGGRADLARDCRRYNELVRDGWLVLRFAWEHVMFDEAWVAAVVTDVVQARRAALRRPGRRGRGGAGGGA